MDSEYLKQHVGRALAMGLAEVSQVKPIDPIEYLAKWLKQHVQNLKQEELLAQETIQLEAQRKQAAEEKKLQEALIEEQNRIAMEIRKREMSKETAGEPQKDDRTEHAGEQAGELKSESNEETPQVVVATQSMESTQTQGEGDKQNNNGDTNVVEGASENTVESQGGEGATVEEDGGDETTDLKDSLDMS